MKSLGIRLFVGIICLMPLAVLAAPVGQWTFDVGNDLTKATVGQALTVQGTCNAIIGPETGDNAVRIGVGSFFTVAHGIAANGGTNVNEYSLVFDLRIPQIGQYYSLFQTDTLNANDGDFFINPTGHIGVAEAGYSSVVLAPDRWYRVVVSVKNGSWLRCYADGVLMLEGTAGSVDGRFALYPQVLFFADENGEDNSIDIARLEVYNKALSGDDVALLGGYTKATPSSLEISEKDQFKLLVATDLHCDLQDNDDLRVFSDLSSIIANYRPDLLILDGDLATNLGFNGLKWVIDHVAELGIPWVYARGNHDDPADLTQFHAYLSSAANSLHRGTSADPNYRLEMRNKGESKTLWNLFIIDDGSYTPTMGFKQAQIDWFKAEVARIGANPPPAFVFCHIPLPQYQQVWDNGATGEKNEAICFESSLPEAFSALVESHQVRGMWCGHDHVNNYYGTLDGVMLAYARHTGYHSYGDLKRGATLITVNAASQGFTTQTVFADDPLASRTTSRAPGVLAPCRLWFTGVLLRNDSRTSLHDFRLTDLNGRTLFARTTISARSAVKLNLPSGRYLATYRIDTRHICTPIVKAN
jgi:hypothetical protein